MRDWSGLSGGSVVVRDFLEYGIYKNLGFIGRHKCGIHNKFASSEY
jgi:hypothetical protein